MQAQLDAQKAEMAELRLLLPHNAGARRVKAPQTETTPRSGAAGSGAAGSAPSPFSQQQQEPARGAHRPRPRVLRVFGVLGRLVVGWSRCGGAPPAAHDPTQTACCAHAQTAQN